MRAAHAVHPPSEMVADLVLCTDCGRKPATRAAGKGGRRGTDFCYACWREEFTDAGGARGDESVANELNAGSYLGRGNNP